VLTRARAETLRGVCKEDSISDSAQGTDNARRLSSLSGREIPRKSIRRENGGDKKKKGEKGGLTGG